MNTYFLLWTYLGNYSDKPLKVEAENPGAAIDKLCRWYSKDFAEKATIFVYETLPVETQIKGIRDN